jgi:hypothetical protein
MFRWTTAILIFLSLTLQSAVGQTHKYGIKSGSVTFEMETTLGPTQIKEKIVLWFDDYGMKEARESYDDGVLKEATMTDGDSVYLIKPSARTAFKRGKASRGIEYKFDWNEVSASDKKEGKAKQLPARAVAGKQCDAYEYLSGGTVSTFAGWMGITLFSEVKRTNMSVTTRAVKLEEGIAVPAEKFRVPDGYAVK